MYDVFSHTPGWILLSIFSFVPAAIAVALHAFFRRRVPAYRLQPHHEVAGFLVAIVGVLYAVMLGFLVISVWASFDLAQRNADAETNDVSDILHLALAFPQPASTRTRDLIGRYALEVRNREWDMLAEGREDVTARRLMLDALGAVATMRPASHADVIEVQRVGSLRESLLASFRSLSSHRRLRLLDAQSHVPVTLYFALALGGLILLAFVFLFGVDNQALQLTMTALVAGMIGLQVGVVFELDRPFWGAVHVTPGAWDLLIRDTGLERLKAPDQVQNKDVGHRP